MRDAPFEVTIVIERSGAGVYRSQPLGGGTVNSPRGPVEIEIATQQAVSTENGQVVEGPMRFAVMLEGKVFVIDATDMLERIAQAALADESPPPRTSLRLEP